MGMLNCKTLKLPLPSKKSSNVYMPLPQTDYYSKISYYMHQLGYPKNLYSSLETNCLWTDGNKIYYSGGNINMEFDSKTFTWKQKKWNNAPNEMYGTYNWSDGENIFSSYVNAKDTYKLDIATDTWEPFEMYGLDDLPQFYSPRIWTDGNNIYYSDEYSQLIYNKTTRVWSPKIWNGTAPEQGYYVWTDGNNIFHSSYQDTFILNKETDTWSMVHLNSTNTGDTVIFCGDELWYDGESIRLNYTRYGNNKYYKLQDGVWIEVSQIVNIDNTIYGMDFWSDGNYIYYSPLYHGLIYGMLLPDDITLYVYENGKWDRIGTVEKE